MATGVRKRFNSEKGYGFISQSDGVDVPSTTRPSKCQVTGPSLEGQAVESTFRRARRGCKQPTLPVLSPPTPRGPSPLSGRSSTPPGPPFFGLGPKAPVPPRRTALLVADLVPDDSACSGARPRRQGRSDLGSL